MTHANRFSGGIAAFTGAKGVLVILLVLACASNAASDDQTRVRRYLLSAGANNGGTDRVLLRYAVSDARAFAAVLTEMGGVERRNAFILANPNGGELLGGILHLNRLIAKDRAADREARTEVFVYYSGHADIDGLKLGSETFGWNEFRNAVNGIDADVRVAVLDACGSGAITRTKGGVARPAFLSDASSNMKGYAFLTSSNENEASQESDRIGGSYFTHALLSGMRGAADLTGDGKVTINEAYQYAFNETLQSTQNTTAGIQHPSRDMNLAGTGDIVMTDLRETSAILSLGADIEGRFFIRDEKGNLFAELRKVRGRAIELGITPGRYTVQMQAPSRWWTANNVVIAEGRKTTLAMSDMTATQPKRTVARGGGEGLNDGSDDDASEEVIFFEEDHADNGGADSLAPGPADLRDFPVSTDAAPPSLSADSSLSTPPSGAPAPMYAVLPVINPMLDSACRAPRRVKTGFFYTGSSKPDGGTQLSLLVNDARAEFCGAQLALFLNSINSDMNGTQASLGFNLSTGGGSIVQAGGINLAAEDIETQVGALNLTRLHVNRAQAGAINFAGNVWYAQAGVLNIADAVRYVQAGALNIADTIDLVQIGALNITTMAERVQAGIINIAGTVRRPIGILNIAGHSEKTPVGLLNLIGNGIFDATFYIETSKKTSGDIGLSLRTGTPWLYTAFDYSQPIWDDWPKRFGAGIGTRFGLTTPLSVNLEFIGTATRCDENNGRLSDHLLKSRLGFNAAISPFFGVTAGISANTLLDDVKNSRAQIWPAFHAGVTMGRINPPAKND